MSAAPQMAVQVDPAGLSSAQIAALRLFASPAKMRRVPNGWRGAGTAKVSLQLARSLAQLGLVRAGRDGDMVPTGIGRNTLDVADERARQRTRAANERRLGRADAAEDAANG